MLNVHSRDDGIRKDDGVRYDVETYLTDLLYLLERTGAVGLREVLMSDIDCSRYVRWLGVRSCVSLGGQPWGDKNLNTWLKTMHSDRPCAIGVPRAVWMFQRVATNR